MKQAFVKKGNVVPVDIPEPGIKKGFIKIKVLYSTISAGTEMTSIKGSGKSILSRAIEDPSKVLKVHEILKNQGIKNAKSKVTSTIDKLDSIGYSVSGQVIEVGADVENFALGDLVSAGGSGFAVHAGVVTVPKNLVVKVPEGLDLKAASTGTVGSIALHGVRRADLRIGEYAVVFGVGLLGLFSLQLLKSSGVRVACIDINTSRLNLANELGADLTINSKEEDPVSAISNWTSGYGADAVLFLAATAQDEPLSQAFRMCRRKGKVVMVGVSGMNINRNDIYRNEIDFIISTSYGPGRYDDNYELGGVDYPYAYIRWTENRNINEFLRLIRDGKVNIERLKPVVYSIDKVETAYSNLKQYPGEHILTILQFTESNQDREKSAVIVNSVKRTDKDSLCIGLIGSGSFAVGTLLPIIYENADKFRLKIIVDITGDRALNAARQFKAERVSSDPADIFNDEEIDLVMICTHHNSHAEFVLESLNHKKHVYVEKPLAITLDQLTAIEQYYKDSGTSESPIIMVGFNRRFSKHAREIKRVLSSRSSPVLMHYRMNVGFVPYDSWIHQDGGRIVGEACHVIDLMLFLTGSEIVEFSVNSFHPYSGKFQASDNKSITFTFSDGSVGVLDYFSCGSNNLSKEYLEIHFDNKSLILDDYRSLKGFGIKVREMKSTQPKKGHKEEWMELYQSIKSGRWPIPLENLIHTTQISITAGFPSV